MWHLSCCDIIKIGNLREKIADFYLFPFHSSLKMGLIFGKESVAVKSEEAAYELWLLFFSNILFRAVLNVILSVADKPQVKYCSTLGLRNAGKVGPR